MGVTRLILEKLPRQIAEALMRFSMAQKNSAVRLTFASKKSICSVAPCEFNCGINNK
jgi:hypothetical protein